MPTIRVLYTDVDGTLVGPLGNLFHTGDRELTLAAANAIVRAHREGLEIVPLSGRARLRMFELGRLLGLQSWICELGGLRVYRGGGELVVDGGEYDGPGRPVDALARASAGLVDAFTTLEPHDPWNEGREVSLLLRGDADDRAVRTWLDANGFAWAELHDNGVIPRHFSSLPGVERVRVYHLSPRGISKPRAIAADQAHRGLEPSECAMIGDAPSDLACHEYVARCFLVRNAVDKDPELAAAADTVGNATVTELGFGEGFAEVVDTLLTVRT
jgi:hydroxymethylpyrimidine pyrophosphatase-like HAD family hydrolase